MKKKALYLSYTLTKTTDLDQMDTGVSSALAKAKGVCSTSGGLFRRRKRRCVYSCDTGAGFGHRDWMCDDPSRAWTPSQVARLRRELKKLPTPVRVKLRAVHKDN